IAPGGHYGAQEANDEDALAAGPLTQPGKGDHPEEGPEVLDDAVDPLPLRLGHLDVGLCDHLATQRVGDHVVRKFGREGVDAPEADEPGNAEHHPEQGRLAPTRLAEEAAVGAHAFSGQLAVIASLDPLFGLLEPNLD